VWDPDGTDPKPFVAHRKMWEWLFICHALAERSRLEPGQLGLGFGVGREPLVALFAAMGCRITATDLDPQRAQAAGWSDGKQYAGTLETLNDHRLCDPELFASRVSFRHVDMNAVPADLTGYDFTWSSCAFEHLGSIDAGIRFVLDQMRCLRPGGTAVHTTEFNLSSNADTVSSGGTVLFRRRDIDALLGRLRDAGFVVDGDFTPGETPADRHVDVPPFSETHLRTTLGEYVTTSVALVIEKPQDWSEGSGPTHQPRGSIRRAGGQRSWWRPARRSPAPG
jgi:hypothetical protein